MLALTWLSEADRGAIGFVLRIYNEVLVDGRGARDLGRGPVALLSLDPIGSRCEAKLAPDREITVMLTLTS